MISYDERAFRVSYGKKEQHVTGNLKERVNSLWIVVVPNLRKAVLMREQKNCNETKKENVLRIISRLCCAQLDWGNDAKPPVKKDRFIFLMNE